MERIAVPMIGGMISSTLLTLLVIPALYAIVKGAQLLGAREQRGTFWVAARPPKGR
jgi:Cu/Ag efflux pump CusA